MSAVNEEILKQCEDVLTPSEVGRRSDIFAFDADSTRRRKSLSRRIGQNGYVEVKNGYYRGRYRIDVPGQHERVNRAVILGSVSEMTKSEARRKLKSVIAVEGLNEPSYAIPSSELFRDRVTNWRCSYLVRQKPSTQATMDSHIEKYLLPKWGDQPIDSIREETVDEWIAALSGLAPSTQRGIVKTLQTVLGKRFDKKLIHFPSELVARRQHPCHTPQQNAAYRRFRERTLQRSVCYRGGNRNAIRRNLRLAR